MSVKRYARSPETLNPKTVLRALLTENPDGEYVLHSDYEALRKKRDRLAAIVERQEKQIHMWRRMGVCRCGHELSRHDPEDGSCDCHSSTTLGACDCNYAVEAAAKEVGSE